MDPFTNMDSFFYFCREISSQILPLVLFVGCAMVIYCISSMSQTKFDTKDSDKLN